MQSHALGRRRHVLMEGEMGQEGVYFERSHVLWWAFLMEQDKTSDPRFGMHAHLFEALYQTHMIESFFLDSLHSPRLEYVPLSSSRGPLVLPHRVAVPGLYSGSALMRSLFPMRGGGTL